MFILEHLEIVERSEMERILTLFEACDVNGDGVLDLQDIKSRMSSNNVRRVASMMTRRASGMSRAASNAIRTMAHPILPTVGSLECPLVD